MTAYVTIPVATVENVLKLPNAALRFKPPPSAVHGAIASEPESPDDSMVVWKLVSPTRLVPVRVVLGITDHAYTEVKAVLSGDLRPGDDVVTTALTPKGGPPGTQGPRR
jgi:HlyD family secretion protein